MMKNKETSVRCSWFRVICLVLLLRLRGSLSFYFNSSDQAQAQAQPTLCLPHQSSTLLQFKHSFSVNCSHFPWFWERIIYPKTNSWKEGSDCCVWDGVTCDAETGFVIALDLSCSCLHSVSPSNTSLLLLPHLRMLNLAFNDFRQSPLASVFGGQFTTLTHLNVSHSGFEGPIPSPIFSHLPKLVSLDLSFNYALSFERHGFEKMLANSTQIRQLFLDQVDMSLVDPASFLNLSSSIVSLSLGGRNNQLLGKLPQELFHFPFLQMLRTTPLHLDHDHVSWEVSFPKTNMTSPLRSLQLPFVSIAFAGQHLLNSIGNDLRFLEVLDMSNCNLNGSIPHSFANLTHLIRLDLSFNNILGQLPPPFSNFKHLQYFDLSHNQLDGQIRDDFGNLTQLFRLSLRSNQLSGNLPFSVLNLPNIVLVDLSQNELVGSLPSQVTGLSLLLKLWLSGNFLDGRIPPWLFTLPSLFSLDLTDNKFTGPIDPFAQPAASLLEYVDLQNNEIRGPIPTSVFALVSLTILDLSSNRLTGISEPNINLPKLNKLDTLNLSNNTLLSFKSTGRNANYISAPNLRSLKLSSCNITEFPWFVRNLEGLEELHLSYNRISVIEANMFTRLKSLRFLDLSHNTQLSLNAIPTLPLPNLERLLFSSCNTTEFPNFLTTLKNLSELNLSNNSIHGKISKWESESEGWPSLRSLDLSNNFLTGIDYYPWKNVMTLNLRSNLLEGSLLVPPLSTMIFIISKNKLTGKIPSLICSLEILEILDLSENNLSGTLPICIGGFSILLTILDLQRNKFHGNIPHSFLQGNRLQTINLGSNDLDGPLPKSLVNCSWLEVLNVGNNKIYDTFPHWLGALPKLKVLVLRSNNFHGELINSNMKGSPFPDLRIFDLSHNDFSGSLQPFLQSFQSMKNLGNVAMRYIGENGDLIDTYYHDSVVITMKGAEFQFERILTIFTTIDMSSNRFEGEIPEIIGKLASLQVLNFSHNNFISHIPSSIVNLTQLESLDVSSNKLTGHIPTQLTGLGFLEVLNLSENRLVGPIPMGKQFNTFPNDSYIGNPGLCGFPLSKTCGSGKPEAPPSHEQKADSDSVFQWKAALIGYGSGLVFGISASYIMLTLGRPFWLVKMVEEATYKLKTYLTTRARARARA
ncbi:hypothetical protein CCACVL1_11318 [Corchorus capsularis]|uniref:Leucine-rich repeat-containing N-terminal plant-type domain-containing protein n=1 Tax=Corchorus capsularis TaxID=210143 RepID=A0A1R3IM30_COCAP|nr:hypothetical protein CCACVL1_11318 [Corchorus capsularis]